MDAPQNNKFTMAQAVNTVLLGTDYQPLWQTLPGFVQLQADLAAEIALVIELSPKAIRRKTGSAEDKGAARKTMCKAALVIAGGVAAYAHKVGNHELLVRVDTTLTLLTGGRGKDSRDKCEDIRAAAATNLAALGDFGVDQAGLDKLKGLIADFDGLTPQPQVALGSAKGAGQAIAEALDKIEGILENGLDNLMLRFEDSHPDFFRDYTNARIIIDRPGGHGSNGDETPAPKPDAPVK